MTTSPTEQARAALALVFDGVYSMRSDSPLTAVGMSARDRVCVSDAVQSVCGVRLTDQDFASVVTVDDLAKAIHSRSELSETP